MRSHGLAAASPDHRSPPPAAEIGGSESLHLAEADHRIANHLALLTSFVRLQDADVAHQSAEPSRASVRLLLNRLGAQIDAIARLHRALAVGGPHASADLGEHLRETCAPFRHGLSGAIELTEDFPPGCLVRTDQILPLTQIVAEVITNALKHAHAGGEGGAIAVRCSQDDRGAMLVEVADDGPGLPAAFDPMTEGGLGFRLVRALARQLGARIEFRSAGPGLRFRLTLPPVHE